MPHYDSLFSTGDWIEIYRTTDEWESNLVQTTLKNQHIQCRPTRERDADGKRQIILSVSRDDQVEALEIVSDINLAIANEEHADRATAKVPARNHLNTPTMNEPPKAAPTVFEEVTIAEREGIGRIIHYPGRGYELRVGPEPYGVIEESRWNEFIDLSAQRQEFSMLLRHEYFQLFQWLKAQKLMAEFIRLVESTYREVPPPRRRNQHPDAAAALDSSSSGKAVVRISFFAKASLGFALISLSAVNFQLQWNVGYGLSLLAIVTGIGAKFHINARGGALKGGRIAMFAVIIACVAIVLRTIFSFLGG
ncbi:MAG: hypothetical protein OXP71_09895 [Candidatus Poribacteria bacterium]|nr:hypothetical protein [Candidatus Poribacteria bacterium]